MARRFVAILALLHAAVAVPSIIRKGQFLYNADTSARFTIKGLAYQYPAPIAASSTEAGFGGFPEPDSYFDSLADLAACQRDLPNFIALGVNTLRVYSVDPYADHSACMNLLDKNGIYIISDLGLPLNGSIDRASPQWTTNLMNQYMTVIDNLAQYPNLLAVSVGNEVVTLPNNTAAASVVKAAARDIKAYIKSRGYKVLTAYSSTDGAAWRTNLAAFLTCGSDDVSVDLIGLNAYRWCGDSTYAASGYETLTKEFANYPVPAYLSEYGCISQSRTWSDVPVIFSSPMADTWSGGIAFEYFQDTLGYGMTNNITTRDAAITTNSDFTLLSRAYTAATAPTTPALASVQNPTYPACAANGANGADFLASNTLPQTPDGTVCQCLSAFALPCTVRASATPAIIGSLLDYTCSLLGANGMSCDDVASNPATGVYGKVSFCSPADKLNYVMTMYYESQSNDPRACSFSNNATVNLRAPSTPTAVQSAIQSCLAEGKGASSGGVFTPSHVPALVVPSSQGSGTTGANSGQSTDSGASTLAAAAAAALGGALALFSGAMVVL